MYRRYSVFPDDRSRGLPIRTVEANCPITIFMDESGNGNSGRPLVVGAVVVDASVGDIEAEITQLYRELAARRSLRGHKGFEKFRKSGFHASTDPLEISQPFIEYIQRSGAFKIYLMTSGRPADQGRTEAQLISGMYEAIIADNLIRYRGQAAITVCIEENDGLRRMLRSLPMFSRYHALVKLGTITELPEVRVEMVKKGSAMTVAIIDYAMLAASRWISSGFTTDPSNRAYRGFREIAPAISYFHSLEDGKLATRKIRFE